MIYNLIVFLLVPFAVTKFIIRSIKEPDYAKNILERFGFYFKNEPKYDSIWIHAVSVGETYASENLIKYLLKTKPDLPITFTTSTPSGRKIARKLFANTITVVYFPLDISFAIDRFIDKFKPSKAIMMETEIWPNLILKLKKKKIPIYLINARLSKKSARNYASWYKLIGPSIKKIDLIIAQTRNDAKRLRFLSKKIISVAGSMKFDRDIKNSDKALGDKIREKIGHSCTIFLAASTGSGEEKYLIPTILSLREFKNSATIIAPRHPKRLQEIVRLLEKHSISCQTLSSVDNLTKKYEVFIEDELGKLYASYWASDIAFVGGSLVPLGGQNFFEAFAAKTPVIIGKHTFNFEELANQAEKYGAICRVNNDCDLKDYVINLLRSRKTRDRMIQLGTNFLEKKRGATKKTLEVLGLLSKKA